MAENTTTKMRAAGVAVRAGGMLLFLKRSPDSDHPGEWCFPGGGVEEGEDAEAAATRELDEETGILKPDNFEPLHESDGDTVHFTTFGADIDEPVVPKLNPEHVAWAWARPEDAPEPLHPGVRATIDAGSNTLASDLLPAYALAMDEATVGVLRAGRACMAMDEGSVRTYDQDGRMRVSRTNISKANVCPYLGKEIPKYKDLGLDPQRVYYLLRDPVELDKAAPTSNGVPLLLKHVAVTADSHEPDIVVGSIGTEAFFEGPYLKNSLIVWTRDGIKAIESSSQKELSSAYHYRADMTPGVFDGVRYDGVMRDMRFNHVALVKNGRAGDDVVVGDSTEELDKMSTVLSRKAAMARGALTVFLKPKLAADAKLDLDKILLGTTAKNWMDKKKSIADAIKPALAQDASMEDIHGLLNSLDKEEPVEDAIIVDNAADPAIKPGVAAAAKDAGGTCNAEALEFLKGKLSPEDMAAFAQLAAAPPATDEEGTDPTAAALDKENEDVKDKEDTVSKPAMDAAIDLAVKKATADTLATARAISEAIDDVQPHVGKLRMAFDSADAVYGAALDALKVDRKDIHPSAFKAVLKAQPVPGTKKPSEPAIAMDSATITAYDTMFPGASRIGNA